MNDELLIELDGDGPLYAQLYRALRRAILERRLAPGARLPATRRLGAELGLSRNTVVEAVEQLVAEGYAIGRRGSGTYVSTELPETLTQVGSATGASRSLDGGTPTIDRPEAGARPTLSAPTAAPSTAHGSAADQQDGEPRLSAAARRALAVAPRGATSWDIRRGHVPYDFRYGEPAYQDFPFDTWARLVGRRLRAARLGDLAYRKPGGHPELRAALADYLVRARGARCTAEQIVVVYGSQQAVDISARMLLDPGDRVALEEPHYPGFRLALESFGVELVGVPVDEHGLVVDRLPKDIRLACVTPSHQYPTGAVLPAARRLALLEWARTSGALVLEDDYDSEYRYDGRPLACLQGLDESGSVIYAGTFSKVMFPALRTGYVVLPERYVEPFSRIKALADTGAATVEQVVLAEFLADGHFERHLRRTRHNNAERRAALVDALENELGDRVSISGTSAGLHVLVELPGGNVSDVRTLRRAALGAGVGIYPTDICYLGEPDGAHFLMGYSSMEPPRIAEGVRLLARAFDDAKL